MLSPMKLKHDIAIIHRNRKLFGKHKTGQMVLYVPLESPNKDHAFDDECIPEIVVV